SIVMMQSSAESRKVRLRASSVVAGLLTLFRWSCSDDIGATGHGFINCYEATWNAERLTDLTCGRQSFSHKTKVSYCLPSGSNFALPLTILSALLKLAAQASGRRISAAPFPSQSRAPVRASC